LSLLLLLVFAYANFLCAAGGEDDKECEHEAAYSHVAAPDRHSCGGAETGHQQQDPNHPHDCSRESCFCVTMNTVVTQQTIAKPKPAISLLLPLSVLNIPSVMPYFTVLAYEHGPPAIAPPAYLSAKIISPRAPPRVA
jgi:hypothetical protein